MRTSRMKRLLTTILTVCLIITLAPVANCGSRTLAKSKKKAPEITGHTFKKNMKNVTVTVKWNRVKKAKAYKVVVFVKNKKTGKYITLKTGKVKVTKKNKKAKTCAYSFTGNYGTSYKVKVRKSKKKKGPWSRALTINTPASKTIPSMGPVSGLTVSKKNTGEITARWKGPNGSSRYVVELINRRTRDKIFRVIVQDSKYSFHVGQGDYDVRVCVFNGQTTGAWAYKEFSFQEEPQP